MLLEISQEELVSLLQRQLGNLFCFDPSTDSAALEESVIEGLERTHYCFSQTKQKRYQRDGVPYFNPWNSAQYCIFLYFVSNTLSHQKHGSLADRVYFLNKALNGLDLFHEVEMPRHFALDHPVGSVLGRAIYGEGFTFAQNCTVGNNRGIYPRLGNDVRMMSGAKILGKCKVGDHVIFGANSYIKDMDVPSCSLVFGQYPNNVIKKRDLSYFTDTPSLQVT